MDQSTLAIQINILDKVDLIEEGLWDHYSGLPNPLWYQYKKESEDEKDDTADSIGNRDADQKN